MARGLHYEAIGTQHLDRAVDLVLSAYESEREHRPDLPEGSAFRSSPVFMPTEIGDPAEDLAKWMTEPDHHLWIAFADGCTAEALGYIRIEPKGMSFVSAHPSAMNITGAYVAEGARGEGIGTALLAAIQEWLSSNGYRFCGVDFESINAVGSRFWNRYFTPYTYSVVRRIDERIQRYL